MAGTQVASLFVHLALNNQMTSALRSARGDFDGFRSNVRSGMQTLYTEAVRLSGAIAAVFGAGRVIGAVAEFDKNLKNIQAVSKRTNEEMKALGDEILRISENSIYGGGAASKTFYQIASAVEDANAQMTIFKTSLNLAASGQADLEKTTDFMIAVMQSFGFESDKAAYVGDVLAQTVRYGRSEMNAFAAAMAPTANLVASIGANFEEWGAGVSYMDKLGATAAMAATRYQRMIISLLNPNTTMEGILADMGVGSGTELVAKYGGSIAEAYRQIYAAIGGDKNMLMQAVGRQEAFNGALALIEDGFKEYAAVFSSDIAGQTSQMLAVQMEALTAKFGLFKSQIEAVAIRLGQALAPALGGFLDLITGLVDGLNRINPAILPFIGGMVILVTALVPSLPLIRAVGLAFTALFAPVLAVGGLVTGVLYAIATNFMGLRNVFTGLINAIAGPLHIFGEYIRVGLLNFFSEGRGSIRDRLDYFFTNSLPGILKSGGDLVRIAAKSILFALGDLVNTAAILLPRLLTGGGNLFLMLLKGLAGGIDFSGVIDTIGGWLSSDAVTLFMSRVHAFIAVADGWLRTEGKRIFDEAVAAALTIFSNIQTWFDENAAPIVDSITTWIDGAIAWLQGDEAKGLLSGALKTAFGFIGGVVDWLDTLAPSIAKWLGDAAAYIIQNGGGIIKNALESIFSVGEESDYPLAQGRGTLDKVGDTFVGTVASVMQRIVDEINRFVDTKIDLPDWADGLINTVLDPLSSAFKTLQEINWDNVGAAAAPILLVLGAAAAGLRLFAPALDLIGKVVGFELLVSFLKQLDEIGQSLKENNIGETIRNIAEAALILGGALLVLNAGSVGKGILTGLVGGFGGKVVEAGAAQAAGAVGGNLFVGLGKSVGNALSGAIGGVFNTAAGWVLGARMLFEDIIGGVFSLAKPWVLGARMLFEDIFAKIFVVTSGLVSTVTSFFGAALAAVFANPLLFGIAAISIIAGTVLLSQIASLPGQPNPYTEESNPTRTALGLDALTPGDYMEYTGSAGADMGIGGGIFMTNGENSPFGGFGRAFKANERRVVDKIDVNAQQVQIGTETLEQTGIGLATAFASNLTVEQRSTLDELFRGFGLSLFGRMAQPGQVLGNVIFNFDEKTELLLNRFVDTVLSRPPQPGVRGGGTRRALGGTVWPGMLNQVGEPGPELFSTSNGLYLIPGQRGEVIPLGRGGGLGGSIQVNGPINVYGVQDPDGLLDALQQAARNRNANIFVRDR